MQRFPDGTKADIEDFRSSGWQNVVRSAEEAGYSSLWKAFGDAARKAIEEGNASQGKVLWLLADACSMLLAPGSTNEPFRPMMQFSEGRSAIPQDFSEEDAVLLAEISEEVDEINLQARLADLAWLTVRPPNHQYALRAIDAYQAIPIDTETWWRDGQDCWKRGIRLAKQMGGGAGDRLAQMEQAVWGAFEASTRDQGFFALQLARLLEEAGLGQGSNEAIAKKLDQFAQEFDAEGDFQRSREHFSASVSWFQDIENTEAVILNTIAVAESWVKEAEARQSSADPSNMVAVGFYENAIQIFRTIPRKNRDEHDIDNKLEELQARLAEAGERSLDELRVESTGPLDVSHFIRRSREAVQGKPLEDALLGLSNIFGSAKVADFRASAEKLLDAHPIQALFGATHFSRDGRVVGKQPGLDAGDEDKESYEKNVWSQMLNQYGIHMDIGVKANVMPALEIITFEHRLNEDFFVSLATNSPIVPPRREYLVGKAIFLGFERDFAAAMHIMTPQFEEIVRYHLRKNGIQTTHLDQVGVETENSLNKLVLMPETEKIFGEDFVFELKALMCEPIGFNLRNDLAHGLIDDLGSRSVASVYCWWFGLRIVYNTWWKTSSKGKY